MNKEVLEFIEWYERDYHEYDNWTCVALLEWVLATHPEKENELQEVWSCYLATYVKPYTDCDLSPFTDIAKIKLGLTGPHDHFAHMDKIELTVRDERKLFVQWVKRQVTTC